MLGLWALIGPFTAFITISVKVKLSFLLLRLKKTIINVVKDKTDCSYLFKKLTAGSSDKIWLCGLIFNQARRRWRGDKMTPSSQQMQQEKGIRSKQQSGFMKAFLNSHQRSAPRFSAVFDPNIHYWSTLVMTSGSWCSSPPLRVNPHGAPPKRQTLTSFQPSVSLLLWFRSPGLGITGQNLTASAEWTSLSYASASISLPTQGQRGQLDTICSPDTLPTPQPGEGMVLAFNLKPQKDQPSSQWERPETDRALSEQRGQKALILEISCF